MKRLLAASLLGALAMTPSVSSADPVQQCRSMTVQPPALTFPANATTPIVVDIFDPGVVKDFEDYLPPALFIENDGSWDTVDYDLRPSPNALPLQRELVVTEYQEGRYIVTWDDTCGGEVSPVDPGQVIVGSFEVLPPVEPPAGLGPGSIDGEAVGGENPYWTSDFTADLNETWRPWHDSMRVDLEIDGQRVWGPSGGPGLVSGDVFTANYTYNCGLESFSPGEYEAVIIARAGGVEHQTDPFPVEIICLPPEPGGCSVSGTGSGSWLPFGLLLFAAVRRRRPALEE